jgi:hypothetical protein
MALTNENSAELAKVLATPPQSLNPDEWHGRFRPYRFTFTQGAAAGDANSFARLVKLPAGRYRVFLALSRVANSAFGASRTLNLGWEAYTDINGQAVAASVNGLDAAQDVAAAGAYPPIGTVGGDESFLFESRSGVVINAQVLAGTIPVGATLKGYFLVVSD